MNNTKEVLSCNKIILSDQNALCSKRRAELNRLTADQYSYMKKIIKIARLPEAKSINTAINRSFRCVAYFMKIRELEIQKKIIISEPIPNLKTGRAVLFENEHI